MDYYSSVGVKIVFDYFKNFEVNIVGFLPASYARQRPANGDRGNGLMETEDLDILNLLIGTRKVIYRRSCNIFFLLFVQLHSS